MAGIQHTSRAKGRRHNHSSKSLMIKELSFSHETPCVSFCQTLCVLLSLPFISHWERPAKGNTGTFSRWSELVGWPICNGMYKVFLYINMSLLNILCVCKHHSFRVVPFLSGVDTVEWSPVFVSLCCHFWGIFHPKIKLHITFRHPQVVSGFQFSVEPKIF